MDQRILQCRELKKIWKKEHCRGLWYWRLLTALALAGSLGLAVLWADARWWGSRIHQTLSLVPFSFAHWAALGALALALIFRLCLLRKRKLLRRSDAYLEWRTLKTALATEKEEL